MKLEAPKLIAEKIGRAASAWEVLAPDSTFGGMTLAQFKTKVQPSLDARDTVKTVANQRVDAQTKRAEGDLETQRVLALVINSIKGDPVHGEDSALYKACGYVLKSERKSGLSRKTKTAQLQQKAA